MEHRGGGYRWWNRECRTTMKSTHDVTRTHPLSNNLLWHRGVWASAPEGLPNVFVQGGSKRWGHRFGPDLFTSAPHPAPYQRGTAGAAASRRLWRARAPSARRSSTSESSVAMWVLRVWSQIKMTGPVKRKHFARRSESRSSRPSPQMKIFAAKVRVTRLLGIPTVTGVLFLQAWPRMLPNPLPTDRLQ